MALPFNNISMFICGFRVSKTLILIPTFLVFVNLKPIEAEINIKDFFETKFLQKQMFQNVEFDYEYKNDTIPKKSSSPLILYFNDTTGEISKNPYLKKLDGAPTIEEMSIDIYEDEFISKILSEISTIEGEPSVTEGDSFKAFYNNSKTRLILYSIDKSNQLDVVRFYDEHGKLLNRRYFKGGAYSSLSYNSSKTFVSTISIEGIFWIFDENGRIKMKGDANNYFKKRSNNFFGINVTIDGSKIVLFGLDGAVVINSENYTLFNTEREIQASFIDDEKNLLFLAQPTQLLIYHLSDPIQLIAKSNHIPICCIKEKFVMYYSKAKKGIKFYYEILR